MLKHIKKMLMFIPCMILGIFMLNSMNVCAEEWYLNNGDVNAVSVGEGTGLETTYYFTDDLSWEFKTKLTNSQKLTRSMITYVVVDPQGNATKESDGIVFVQSESGNIVGKFSISDISSLAFSEKVDISQRVSVVPKSTYYIDIKYYSCNYWCNEKKDQQNGADTVRVVLGNDSKLGIPKVDVAFDKATNQFKIDASILVDDKGYSLVNSVEYYFSKEPVENEISTFRNNMETSELKNRIEGFNSSTVKVEEIDKPSDEYKYMYVMVTTHSGYSKIVAFDMNEDENSTEASGVSKNPLNSNNTNNESGWPDFEFGELILLVLVVVLIVSCVLIITQKIVDYKKRLY